MLKLSEWILRHRKAVLLVALICCVVSVFAMQGVKINYNMADYLPASSPSTQALKLVEGGLPNMQVYVPDVTPQQALEVKQQLRDIPKVEGVLWLDDTVDLRATPWEVIPEKTREGYYADGGALYQVTVGYDDAAGVFQAVQALYPDAIYKGEAPNQARLQTVTMGEIASIMYYVVPIVILILLLSTSHWFEPLLFMLVIGVAIVINEGTNIIFGEISFVTQACSAVLQLAVSIDYAVFLLHRFAEYREAGMDAREAMKTAMQKAASAIAASAMTTVFGFLALLVMGFGLGRDMGLVLAKGVMLSYLSVVIVLPAAAMASIKLIDKTAHRRLLPSFEGFGRAVVRYGAPLAAIVLILLVPAYLGQTRNNFVYGSSGMHGPNSDAQREASRIDDIFGRSQMMMLMVPQGEPAKTAELSDEAKALPYVRSVISYAETVGVQIPPQVVPDSALSMLRGNGYDRLLLSVDSLDEGERAFSIVEEIRALAGRYYPEDFHLLGESVVNYDVRESITADNLKVLLFGVIAIGLILLITFRNLSIPLILLLIIEGAIWFNMAVPYFAGNTLNYIGYQIVSSVQLGATVDYAILLAQRYEEARKTMGKKEAAAWALAKSTGSILPPMLILTIAGYALSIVVTSNAVISQMGEIIGRGAAISGFMVLMVLPTVLRWCDGAINRTNIGKKEAIQS